MGMQLAEDFRRELNAIETALLEIPEELADTPWRVGGWTRKEVVGHMLDSATNNRQRFVRAASDGHFNGPNYGQDAWVAAHGYRNQPWATLLEWWQVEHAILAAVVDCIAEERLSARCVLEDDPPVTLGFLIEDYVRHQHAHLAQLTAPVESA
jgi:hypothetical protein